MNNREILNQRIVAKRSRSIIDFNTTLQHFSIVTYKVEVDRLAAFLPSFLKPKVFYSGGQRFALISAVGFKDCDFGFKKLGNFPRLPFFQTNFRAYITDSNGEDCVWFFGTTLGSWTHLIPQRLWKMPWAHGNYTFDHKTDHGKYSKYNLEWKCSNGNGLIDIRSTKESMKLHEGFDSVDQQLLVLTHPVVGYYYRNDCKVGTYEIWHPEMVLHEGEGLDIRLDRFINLGLLSSDELGTPHSVLITPSIEFDILMPPRIC